MKPTIIPSGTIMNREISGEELCMRILFLREFRRNLYHGRSQLGLTNKELRQYDGEIRTVTHALKRLDPDGIFPA